MLLALPSLIGAVLVLLILNNYRLLWLPPVVQGFFDAIGV
ncbi:hypothetical protein SAMN04488026_103651 [Aliiruegeria lutimaris]|uniref:Uncharacterized protein n=1 Tax=Aliiruegeria lutimaris TaxID=571298 RepID=A0A1G9APL8_9RHOB|nr:hypothetical protein SAMN04488026_103651 [Aliiruegeria lutimaris]